MKIKQIAVAGFMATRPGRIVLKSERSNSHPSKTSKAMIHVIEAR
jgi:hypothetical protein